MEGKRSGGRGDFCVSHDLLGSPRHGSALKSDRVIIKGEVWRARKEGGLHEACGRVPSWVLSGQRSKQGG